MIYIQPDPSSTTNLDIGPAVTTPIKVKSKRNKKKIESAPSQLLKPIAKLVSQKVLPVPNIPLKSVKDTYLKVSAPPLVVPLPPLSTTQTKSAVESRPIVESQPAVAFNRDPFPVTQSYGNIDMSAEITACANWSKKVYDTLSNSLEWQIVAYELIDTKPMPIFRCPACYVYRDTMRNYSRPHENDCKIRDILNGYNLEVRNKLQRLEEYTLGNTINMPVPYSPLYHPSTITSIAPENNSGTTFSLMNVNPNDPTMSFNTPLSFNKDDLQSIFENNPAS